MARSIPPSLHCLFHSEDAQKYDWVKEEVLMMKYDMKEENVNCFDHLGGVSREKDFSNKFITMPTSTDKRICFSYTEEETSFLYMYKLFFDLIGLRLPFSSFKLSFLEVIRITPSQLHPNSWLSSCSSRLCQKWPTKSWALQTSLKATSIGPGKIPSSSTVPSPSSKTAALEKRRTSKRKKTIDSNEVEVTDSPKGKGKETKAEFIVGRDVEPSKVISIIFSSQDREYPQDKTRVDLLLVGL